MINLSVYFVRVRKHIYIYKVIYIKIFSIMYPEYKKLNLSKICSDVKDFWLKEKIFEKSVKSRPENNRFVFYEGPPSANGLPGIHHVMARLIKDIFFWNIVIIFNLLFFYRNRKI